MVMKCSCCRIDTKWLRKVVIDGTDVFLCPRCIELPHKIVMDRVDVARKVVAMHKHGKTFAEIGNYFGLTRQRVHQIYKQWEPVYTDELLSCH